MADERSNYEKAFDPVERSIRHERFRCAAIATLWAQNADVMLGAGWRSAAEIAIAERVAMAIAKSIMGADEKP